MARKIAILLSIFGFLSILNVFLVTQIYARSEKETRIAIILEELDKIELDTTSIETSEYFNDSTVKDKRVAILKAFLRQYD